MIGDFRIQLDAAPHLDRTFSYGLTGFTRVEHLIELYRATRKTLGKTKGRVWTHVSDVLRSAVVLCHANLEQVLRELIVFEAQWSPDYLKGIPLPESGTRRAEKFTLADIEQFRDQTVEDLIFDAVAEHVGKQSFTCVEDVIRVLQMCQLNVEDFRMFFPGLKELIERRHHIAHTADIEYEEGRGKQRTRSISAKQVALWNLNAMSFLGALASGISNRIFKEAEQGETLQPPLATLSATSPVT